MTETATITVTPNQILEEWITDLESGDHPQVTGRLIDTVSSLTPNATQKQKDEGAVGYCCLGILCLVAERHGLLVRVGSGEDHWETASHVPWTDEIEHSEDSTDTEVPTILAAWLGIDANPVLDGVEAIQRNDTNHEPFAIIADAARREYAARGVSA